MAAIIEIDKSKKGSVAMAAQVKKDRIKRKYPIAFFIFNLGINTSARRHAMRFHEFATPTRPVLKISQQANTPVPTNTAPTAVPAEPIRVYPRQWQRAWLQKYLAAHMARSAQTIKPTADDIAIASLQYGEEQRQADREYERIYGVPANPDRRAKRD